MSWYLYIAVSKSGRYYTGITTDPARRIAEHNSGVGAKFARDQGWLELVYVSQSIVDQSAARLRELQVKKWSRVKKEKLIRHEWV